MLVTNHWNYRNDLWQSGKVESTFSVESGTLGFVYWFVFSGTGAGELCDLEQFA